MSAKGSFDSGSEKHAASAQDDESDGGGNASVTRFRTPG